MRRVLLTTISLLALTTGSFAADLPRQMPAKAPAMLPMGHNWTGLYLSINGGYGFGQSHWSAFATDAEPSGRLISLTAGYNWQAPGSPFVFGLESDIDWSNIKGSFTNATCPPATKPRTTGLEPCADASATRSIA